MSLTTTTTSTSVAPACPRHRSINRLQPTWMQSSMTLDYSRHSTFSSGWRSVCPQAGLNWQRAGIMITRLSYCDDWMLSLAGTCAAHGVHAVSACCTAIILSWCLTDATFTAVCALPSHHVNYASCSCYTLRSMYSRQQHKRQNTAYWLLLSNWRQVGYQKPSTDFAKSCGGG